MAQGQQFRIVEGQVVLGPSLASLIGSMSTPCEHSRYGRHAVTFSLATLGQIQVVINGLSLEDGSFGNWLFQGWSPSPEYRGCRVEGYFNTERRRGYLKIFYPN